MTLFWIATLILIIVAISVLLVPMLAGRQFDDQASRDELNKAFYRERVAELQEEAEEGLVDNTGEMAVELQQSLLDDVPGKNENTTSSVSPWMALPGIIVIIGLSLGLYMMKGNIGKVEQWHQISEQLPALSTRLLSETAEPMSDQEMSDLTLALRTRLQQTPDDAMGWLLLGRIGLANRDLQTSVGAMGKAYALEPNNTDVKLGYAQALMFTSDKTDQNKARELLREVIRTDHTNMRAMSLLAFDAFERGSYEEAIAAWSAMKSLLPEGDSRRQMLERSIAQAEAKLNPVHADKSVEVTVSLAPGVTLPKEGVLIVSAHPADGAPMPLAAKRLPLTSFPVSIELTDNDSMIAERKMSSVPDVIVKARIDNDGNVMTRDGDWIGVSEPVKLGGKVDIVINRKQ